MLFFTTTIVFSISCTHSNLKKRDVASLKNDGILRMQLDSDQLELLKIMIGSITDLALKDALMKSATISIVENGVSKTIDRFGQDQKFADLVVKEVLEVWKLYFEDSNGKVEVNKGNIMNYLKDKNSKKNMFAKLQETSYIDEKDFYKNNMNSAVNNLFKIYEVKALNGVIEIESAVLRMVPANKLRELITGKNYNFSIPLLTRLDRDNKSNSLVRISKKYLNKKFAERFQINDNKCHYLTFKTQGFLNQDNQLENSFFYEFEIGYNEVGDFLPEGTLFYSNEINEVNYLDFNKISPAQMPKVLFSIVRLDDIKIAAISNSVDFPKEIMSMNIKFYSGDFSRIRKDITIDNNDVQKIEVYVNTDSEKISGMKSPYHRSFKILDPKSDGLVDCGR